MYLSAGWSASAPRKSASVALSSIFTSHVSDTLAGCSCSHRPCPVVGFFPWNLSSFVPVHSLGATFPSPSRISISSPMGSECSGCPVRSYCTMRFAREMSSECISTMSP